MRWSVVGFACAVLTAGVAASPTGTTGEFTANLREFKSWETEGKQEKIGRIWVKGDRVRMEFSEDGHPVAAQINHPAEKKAWLLQLEERTYMAVDFRGMAATGEAGEEQGRLEKLPLGNEKVAGYECEKVRYTFRDQKDLGSTTQWHSARLAYFLKTVTTGPHGTTRIELTDIREGPVADAQFEIPTGFREMKLGPGRYGAPEAEEAPGALQEDAQEIVDDARGEAKQGVKEEISDRIRKGIRGLFGQ